MKGVLWPICLTATVKMLRLLASKAMMALRTRLDWREADGAYVLHLGCGHGDVTAYELLARLPADVRVVAADRGCAALSYAAAKFDSPRLCFLELDIDTQCIRDTGAWRLGPYLKVFCFFSLQWVHNQRRAIQNISELLCPGGEAVFVLISRSGLLAIFEILSKSPKWSRYLVDYRQFLAPYQFSQHPKEEFRTYLTEAGFTVKSCCENVEVYVSDEELEVRETMVALNPFLPRIPEEEREAFILDCENEAFRSGSLRVSAGVEGKQDYLFTYMSLFALAVKK